MSYRANWDTIVTTYLVSWSLYKRRDQVGLWLLCFNSQVITLPYWVPLCDTCDSSTYMQKYYNDTIACQNDHITISTHLEWNSGIQPGCSSFYLLTICCQYSIIFCTSRYVKDKRRSRVVTIVSTLKLLYYLIGSHSVIHVTVAHIRRSIMQDKDPIRVSLFDHIAIYSHLIKTMHTS